MFVLAISRRQYQCPKCSRRFYLGKIIILTYNRNPTKFLTRNKRKSNLRDEDDKNMFLFRRLFHSSAFISWVIFRICNIELTHSYSTSGS